MVSVIDTVKFGEGKTPPRPLGSPNSFERLVPRGPFPPNDVPPAATGASLYRMRTGEEIDVAVGADIKARARELLSEVCLLMDEARAAGLILTFAVGRNASGAHEVQGVTVVKPL